MINNSYILKRVYQIKKNNSSVSSVNSNFNRHNIFAYEPEKKDAMTNSNINSNSMKESKFHNQKKKSIKKIGSYISLNFIKNLSVYKDNSNNVNDISSIKNGAYDKILVNKAPSFSENKIEITKIIKKKKIEKILDYQNFYNNYKTQHTQYNMFYKNKSNSTKELILSRNMSRFDALKFANNVFNNLTYVKKMNRSKTDGYIDYIGKKMKFNLNNDSSNRNKIKKIKKIKGKGKGKESTIIYDNEKTNENKESNNSNYYNNNSSVLLTLLPLIPRSNRTKLYNKMNISNEIHNSESNKIKLYKSATNKLSNYIMKYLDEKTRTIVQFTNFEKKMVKLKYFQNINKQNLQNVVYSDKFNLDTKITDLIKLNKYANNIWINYRQRMNLYLHFLFDKKNEMETNLGIISRKKKNNENIIEKLMIQAVKKQKELEELVQIRNFLLQVKLKLKKQPPYFSSLLHRDSHKIELGNILLTSTVGTKNSSVIKFLDSFSELNLVQLYETNPRNDILNNIFKRKIRNNRIIKEFKEKYIYEEDLLKKESNYIPKKGEIIFDNPDQLVFLLQNLESKNLFLLERNDSIKKYSSKIKQDFESKYLETEDEEKKAEILEEIKYRENYIIRMKDRNKFLIERLKMVSNEEFIDNNSYTKKLIKAHANSSFVELNFFKMINYIKLLKGYKHHYVLLLEKLITIIKTFIGLKYGDYNLKKCYTFVDNLTLDHILSLKKTDFNDNNQFMVYDYILELLKLYDDIIEYVKNMQRMYEADANNKIFMRKRREEVQNLRKITNAREIRDLLDDKRNRIIEKILEKWNKPVNGAMRKVDDMYAAKMKSKFKSKSIEEKKAIKKRNAQNEINGLIFFD